MNNEQTITDINNGWEDFEGWDRSGIGWTAQVWKEDDLFIVRVSDDDKFTLRRTFTQVEYAAEFLCNL